MKFNPFKGMKEDIKAIQIPSNKERAKTFFNVLFFSVVFGLFLFGCDAFISYMFNLLNI